MSVKQVRLQKISELMPNATEFTRDQVLNAVAGLEKLHDSTGRFLNHYGHEPADDSQAQTELLSFPRPSALKTAYGQGGGLLEVAADQMMALVKTLKEPCQTIAPWTCSRAVLESAALALWLLDTRIDARTRVQRSLALRFEGMVQQVKILRALDKSAERSTATEQIEKLERDALEMGFDRVENDSGRRVGVGERMPAVTDIIVKMLDEEVMYRLLSAMAHAHHFAYQQLSFKKVGESADGASIFAKKDLNFVSVMLLCNKTANVFTRAVETRFRLFGQYTPELEEMIRSASSSLGCIGARANATEKSS